MTSAALTAPIQGLLNGERYTVVVTANSNAGASIPSQTGVGFTLESSSPTPRIDVFFAIAPDHGSDFLPCWRNAQDSYDTYVCRRFISGTYVFAGQQATAQMAYDRLADPAPPGSCTEGATQCQGGGGGYTVLATTNDYYQGCFYRWAQDSWSCAAKVLNATDADHGLFVQDTAAFDATRYYVAPTWKWVKNDGRALGCVDALQRLDAFSIVQRCGIAAYGQ